jgi:small subunit ribosomal protein S7
MWEGKKSVSEHIFYDMLEILAGRTKEDPLVVFRKAFENVKPALEVRSRRIGGHIPGAPGGAAGQAGHARPQVDHRRGQGPLRAHHEREAASELIDAYNNRGTPSRRGKTRTRWRRPTRPSLITGGSTSGQDPDQ